MTHSYKGKLTGDRAACLLHSKFHHYRCIAFLVTTKHFYIVISGCLSITQHSHMCAVIYCRSEVLNSFLGQM